MLVGFAVAGWITDNYKMLDGTTNWQMVWIIPAGIAFLVFFITLLFDSKKEKKFKLFNKII
jgi:MFS family permease